MTAETNGCICIECNKWHSHVHPHPTKKNKWICFDCEKELGVEDGK